MTLNDAKRFRACAMALLFPGCWATFSFAQTTSCPAGQATCPLMEGVVITGQCNGHGSEPGCVLPNLFGPQGFNLPSSFHYAHFIGSAQQLLNTTLSTAIATQIATLPIISPSSGFTFEYDPSAGVYVRSTTSFGPVYSERAETIGRGKVSVGASYQRFRFGSIDGINLHNIPAVLTHVPGTGPGGTKEPYEADVIQTSNDLSLRMDQTVVFGTVGVTDHLDISVAVPITSVRFVAGSDANIIHVSGAYVTFACPPGTMLQLCGMTIPNPHTFAGGGLSNTYPSAGSAAGIGDATFRAKYSIYRGPTLQVAAALDVRAPSGDAREFLGSGALGVKPFVIISANRRFAPHLNLGYQWNGKSILAGNITGATFSAPSGVEDITNGPATKASLPGQLSYSLGADYGATKRLTLSFDYLGQTLFDAPRVFLGTTTTKDDSHACSVYQGTTYCGMAPMTLPTITGGKDSIALSNAALGLKYNLFNQLILTADALFRMDNKGLRQTVTPLIALSYAFGAK